MYNHHRNELHLVAPSKLARDLWIQGLQSLLDNHSNKTQRHLIKEKRFKIELTSDLNFVFSWILNYFRLADVD